jgi:branched-subunit amino acid aminotransferase/4-amino-4-deoxychorismate lyase
MPFINNDGLICMSDEALFSSDNKAFRLGDGLVETMFRMRGRIRLFDLHLMRIRESLALIGFPALDETQFQHAILKTLSANNDPEHAVIRAQFFMRLNHDTLHFFIEILPAGNTGQWPEKGITAGVTHKVLKCFDSISHLKTSSRMQYNVAQRDATVNGWDDAFLLNANDRIVEGTNANIFIIKGNNVFTPPISEGCIAGVVRKYLLDQGSTDNMTFTEKVFDPETLRQADEIFLTNAVKGVIPVQTFMGKQYMTHLTRKVFDKISLL